MTKSEKERLDALPTIGYWTAFGGVEVKQISRGRIHYVWCISYAWDDTHKRCYHMTSIRHTAQRYYILIRGYRLYMDELIDGSQCEAD